MPITKYYKMVKKKTYLLVIPIIIFIIIIILYYINRIFAYSIHPAVILVESKNDNTVIGTKMYKDEGLTLEIIVNDSNVYNLIEVGVEYTISYAAKKDGNYLISIEITEIKDLK